MLGLDLVTTLNGIAGSGFTTGTRPVSSPNGELIGQVRVDNLSVFQRESQTDNFVFTDANPAVGNDGFGNLIDIDFFYGTVEFSPDGKFLYITGSQPDQGRGIAHFGVSDDGRLEFIETTTEIPAGFLLEPVVSPDGNQLYAAVSDSNKNGIAIFDRDRESGVLSFRETHESPGIGSFDRDARITFNEDGSLLAATSGSVGLQIFERDQNTGGLNERETINGGDSDLDGDNVTALNDARVAKFGPGNVIYVTSSADNAISVFEISEGGLDLLEENRNTFDDGFGNKIEGMSGSISPDEIFVFADQNVLAVSAGLNIVFFDIVNEGRALEFVDSVPMGDAGVGRISGEPSIISGNEVFGVTGVETSNQAPKAENDEAQVLVGETISIDVLSNDSDADRDGLSIEDAGNPANGTVTATDDAIVRYTPDSNFTGVDTFTYTVSDGNGGTDTATVTVTVTAVDTGDPTPQARVFLKSGSDFTITSPAEVFGRSGSDETLRFTDEAENVILDGNIENLQVPDKIEETTFQVIDGQLNIGANGDRIMTFFGGLNQDVAITFANDEGTLEQNGPASFTFLGPDGAIEIGSDPVTPVGVGMVDVDAV